MQWPPDPETVRIAREECERQGKPFAAEWKPEVLAIFQAAAQRAAQQRAAS
jgi:hypothetical protein